VAVRSKAKVYSCLTAGIAGSNPTDGMGVRLVFDVCCIGSALCDELITRLEESCQLCVCVCNCV
jgi:hypothetical protein